MLNSLLQMHLKLIQKKQFKKTAEATGDSIRSKITYKITSVSSASPQNTSKTLPNETEDKGKVCIPQKDSQLKIS